MAARKTPAEKQADKQAAAHSKASEETAVSQPDARELPGQDETASPRASEASPQQAKETTSPVLEFDPRELHDALVAAEQRFAQIPLTNSVRVPTEDDLDAIKELLDKASKTLTKARKATR